MLEHKTKTPIPLNETERLQALRETQILDSERETSYDDIVKLAAHLCDTPFAMISLIDQNRQWFKANLGFAARETPRDIAFCAHVVASSTPMIIEDTLLDPQFKSHVLVLTAPFIRFYAGFPLVTSDGFCLGTLCVVGTKPKKLTGSQMAAMKALAQSAISQIELRRSLNKISEQAQRYEHLVSHLKEVVFQVDVSGCWTFLNPAWTEVTQCSVEESLGRHVIEFVHPEDRFQKIAKFRPLVRGKQQFCHDLIRYLRKDGQIRWVELFAKAIHGPKGEVLGISGTLTDITDQKLVHENLEKRERTLKSFFDSCPLMMGTVELTPDDIIYHSCNRETAKFLSVPEAQLQGPVSVKSLQLPEENLKVWRRHYEQARLTQKPIRFTCEYTNPNGAIRTLVGFVNLIPHGSENMFSFVAQDITEEQEARNALKAAGARVPEYA
jgi:PAS domain S-box-containing protein